MKYFWIPAAVLSLLLGASLWNAAATETAIGPWRAAMEEASAAAAREDWDGALALVRGARAEWEASHARFHIITAHDELDQADALFAEAESFAVERDRAEFRAAAAELAAQLQVITESQKLTVRNVL